MEVGEDYSQKEQIQWSQGEMPYWCFVCVCVCGAGVCFYILRQFCYYWTNAFKVQGIPASVVSLIEDKFVLEFERPCNDSID